MKITVSLAFAAVLLASAVPYALRRERLAL